MNSNSILSNLLTRIEAAKVLRVAPRTLDRWYHDRKGPPRFVMGGTAYYDARDLERWVEARKAESPMAA